MSPSRTSSGSDATHTAPHPRRPRRARRRVSSAAGAAAAAAVGSLSSGCGDRHRSRDSPNMSRSGGSGGPMTDGCRMLSDASSSVGSWWTTAGPVAPAGRGGGRGAGNAEPPTSRWAARSRRPDSGHPEASSAGRPGVGLRWRWCHANPEARILPGADSAGWRPASAGLAGVAGSAEPRRFRRLAGADPSGAVRTAAGAAGRSPRPAGRARPRRADGLAALGVSGQRRRRRSRRGVVVGVVGTAGAAAAGARGSRLTDQAAATHWLPVSGFAPGGGIRCRM